MASNASAVTVRTVGMSHWIHLAAVQWTRTQLSVVGVIFSSLVAISLGIAPAPKSVLIIDLIERHPGPAVGLGGALLILSVLAFVVARRPEQPSAPAVIGQEQAIGPRVASAVAPAPPVLTPPRPATPIAARTPGAPGTAAPPTIPLPPPPPAQALNATLTTRVRRWRTIAVAVLILASLALAGFATTLTIKASNDYTQAPANAVAAYCADLMHQDYAHAFELVSAGVQTADGVRSANGTNQFMHFNTLHDDVNGTVQSCQVTGSAQISGSSAQVPVTLTRSLEDQPHTYQVTAHLVFEQNAWRMDFDTPPQAGVVSVPLSAGSDVTPLAVAEDWCQDFVAQNVSLLRSEMSDSYQASKPPDTVIAFYYKLQSVPAPNGPLHLVKCATAYSDYQPQATTFMIHVLLTVAVGSTSGSSNQSVEDMVITVIPQGATWKVDTYEVCTTYANLACTS